ncbi:MAG: molybdopterin synthase catalytic subunit MoaE [Idiomarina sp.]|nr:molybdopterin synthase catalytic subunit MoaE [Idiomarina sp.]
MTIRIRVQNDDFDMAAEYERLRRNDSYGAVVTFTGLVREVQGDHLQAMHLEHYPGMTENVLMTIVKQADARWNLGDVTVIHRVGSLTLNEQIVLVAVSSAHRVDAFEAAQFIMDFLKTKAPFWKKEATTRGEHWVEAKDSDDKAGQRWSVNK